MQVTDSAFSSIFQDPCWALFELWTTVCEVLVFSLKRILWTEMCYWFGGTPYESLEWLQTCNNGYPHSTATVCHWHWQTLHWTAGVELAMGIMLQVVKGIQNVTSVTFHLCVVTTKPLNSLCIMVSDMSTSVLVQRLFWEQQIIVLCSMKPFTSYACFCTGHRPNANVLETNMHMPRNSITLCYRRNGIIKYTFPSLR